MTEETVFSDEKITVTTARIIVDKTTFALRNITSVKAEVTPPKRVLGCFLLIFGGIIIASNKEPNALGITLCIGGVILLVKARTFYHVAISSSSGEVRALTSRDKNYIEKIVESINQAIVSYK